MKVFTKCRIGFAKGVHNTLERINNHESYLTNVSFALLGAMANDVRCVKEATGSLNRVLWDC